MKNSQRTFAVISSTQDTVITDLTIDEIANPGEKDGEIIYALNERLDEVLDLKVYDNIRFQPNRDDKKSKGVIVRTK